MQSTMLKAIVEDFGNGGTIDGDLVVSGDLQVSGGGSLSFDEIVSGTQVVEITNTEALLVRKASDGGDVFIVDTTNSKVSITDTLNVNPTISSGSKTSLAFQRSGSNKWRFIQPHDDSYLKLYNDGASDTQMYFASNNNIGINTNSPKHYSGTSGTVLSIHNSSYRGVLELSGASNSDGGVIGALTFANTENTAANGALAQLYTEVETSDSNAGDDSGGHLLFFTKPEAGTLAESMRIDSSGNVGIGNSSPVDLLHVGAGADSPDVDSVAIFTHTGTTNVAIRDASNNVELLNYAYSGGGLIGTVTNHDLSIRTNNTNRLTITSGGNATFSGDVSIVSSSSSNTKLLIENNNASANALLQIDSSDDRDSVIQLLENGTAKWDIRNDGNDSDKLKISDDGDVRVTLDQSGNVGIGISPLATFHAKMASNVNFTTTANSSSLRLNAVNDAVDATIPLEINSTSTQFLSNVGIGASPSYPLTISKTESSASDFQTNLDIKRNWTLGDATDRLHGLIFSDLNSINAGIFVNRYNSAGNYESHLNFYTNSGSSNMTPSASLGDPKMIINSSGNVGIGATPTRKLSVFGSAYTEAGGADSNIFLSVANSTWSGMALLGGTSQGGFIDFGDTDAVHRGRILYSHANDNMQFNTSAVTRFILDANSRISLGNNDSSGQTTNTIFGRLAGNAVASGANGNTLIGNEAGNDLTTGVRSVIIGETAGATATTSSNMVLVGAFAGDAINSTGADGTVAIGRDALTTLTSGGGNTALGFEALKTVAGGNYNTAFGFEAGESLTQSENTLFGYNAGKLIVSSSRTTLVGAFAGHNINVGSNSSDGSTGVGYGSLGNMTSGGKNTAVGYLCSNTITDGSENTVLGWDSDVSASGAVNQTVIGSETTGQADNSVTLGNASVTAVYMAQDSGATVYGAKPQWADSSNAYYKLIGSKSLTADTVTEFMVVGHSHSYNITFWADSTNDGVAGFHRTAAIYGSSSTSEVHETTYGSGTDNISISYLNSGGSQNYILRVTAASADCTFHYMIEGFGSQTLTAL